MILNAVPNPAPGEAQRVSRAASEFFSEARQARIALQEGDEPAARHHILRLALLPVPVAPPALARLIGLRRLRAVVDLADQYARLRGLSPASSAPTHVAIDFGAGR